MVEVVGDGQQPAAGGFGARADGQVLDDKVGRTLWRRSRRVVGVVVTAAGGDGEGEHQGEEGSA